MRRPVGQQRRVARVDAVAASIFLGLLVTGRVGQSVSEDGFEAAAYMIGEFRHTSIVL